MKNTKQKIILIGMIMIMLSAQAYAAYIGGYQEIRYAGGLLINASSTLDFVVNGTSKIYIANGGFVAQDVEKVFPQWVVNQTESYKEIHIDTTEFRALTVEAIKELELEKDKDIESQQEQIELLKQENQELKQLVCLDHKEADICK